jgi:hypothetical protein
MGKCKKYVSLDKQDLETLVESYASKFYSMVSNGEHDPKDCEVREIVKKLAGFTREYEELIAEESKSVAAGA